MQCLKVSAADTKAERIEASVENSCPYCGAFTSGLAILAHASQLEAQFQNLLSSPCCSYMDVCTYVLSQEAFFFVLNMFVLYPTVVLILNLEAFKHLLKW